VRTCPVTTAAWHKALFASRNERTDVQTTTQFIEYAEWSTFFHCSVTNTLTVSSVHRSSEDL
jgi:hypothetical protein